MYKIGSMFYQSSEKALINHMSKIASSWNSYINKKIWNSHKDLINQKQKNTFVSVIYDNFNESFL
jgi:hypothetical protein